MGITIAIDGYSSCGKSTLAKALAAELNYAYIDSGAMYRSVTLFCLQQGIIKDGTFIKEEVIKILPEIHLSFQFNPKTKTNDIFLNNKNVEREIRTLEVAARASSISTIREVRVQMVNLQRKMGENKSVVMDGRDIGTAVFPDAELKIFMTADTDVRIQRRLDELKVKGEKTTFEEVKKNLLERDFQDTHRKESPLLQAADAIVIDNSDLGKAEQLQIVVKLARERLQKLNEDKVSR
jgi:CMP/dCMP kinase